MAASSKVHDTARVKQVKRAAKTMYRLINEMGVALKENQDGHFAMNPGSDPIQQFTDADAQALGFADASLMQSQVLDFLNAVDNFRSNSFGQVLGAASGGEV